MTNILIHTRVDGPYGKNVLEANHRTFKEAEFGTKVETPFFHDFASLHKLPYYHKLSKLTPKFNAVRHGARYD